jgi:hypothetical protein
VTLSIDGPDGVTRAIALFTLAYQRATRARRGPAAAAAAAAPGPPDA